MADRAHRPQRRVEAAVTVAEGGQDATALIAAHCDERACYSTAPCASPRPTSSESSVSAAYLINRNLAVGAEYRTKPDNLNIATEDDAWDVFVAWAPSKHVSLTVAYVDLGNIVIRDNQRGVYASLQVGF